MERVRQRGWHSHYSAWVRDEGGGAQHHYVFRERQSPSYIPFFSSYRGIGAVRIKTSLTTRPRPSSKSYILHPPVQNERRAPNGDDISYLFPSAEFEAYNGVGVASPLHNVRRAANGHTTPQPKIFLNLQPTKLSPRCIRARRTHAQRRSSWKPPSRKRISPQVRNLPDSAPILQVISHNMAPDQGPEVVGLSRLARIL